MRLSELFQVLPEDHGRLIAPNIPTFDPRYAKIVGMFDGLDVWGSREYPKFDVYGIRADDGDVLAYCRISEAETEDHLRFLRELWTAENQRGKGLATMLLLFLLRKLKLKLLLAHDELLSDQARTMILRGFVANRFKIRDRKGNKLDLDAAGKILRTVGKTDDELVLTEDHLDLELFSDKKIDTGSSWYLVLDSAELLD